MNEKFEIDKRDIKELVMSEKPPNAILICTGFLKTNKIITGDIFLYQE